MLEKRPLICFTDTDGKAVVLGGNMRLKAANEVGLKQLPVILADDWTEEQKAEFLIKDNVGFGEWDWDELANDWDAEKLTDWGLDIPGFAPEKEMDDLSDTIKTEFRIEVICKDEEEQEKTYNKLIEQNYECRILTL
jgi:ParB-like chromosome segregation protein Spo0J